MIFSMIFLTNMPQQIYVRAVIEVQKITLR